MGSSLPDLAKILTPALYSNVINDQLPWPRDKPLDWNEVSRYSLSNEAERKKKPGGLRELWYPALKHLSEVPFSELSSINLLTYLPKPESKEFPEQALALQLLLDQGPRILFPGDTTDSRYTRGYFDVLSLQLTYALLELPEALKPWKRERWPSMEFEYWTIVWLWFIAPLVHSESKSNQKLAQQLIEDFRISIEQQSGKQDPYRKEQEALSKDTKAFPRIVKLGNPKKENLKIEEYWWWILIMLDVHKPIIDHFGRYPHYNTYLGRESTAEELKYLKETEHFGEAKPETRKKIREDVEKGIWTPLGEWEKKKKDV